MVSRVLLVLSVLVCLGSCQNRFPSWMKFGVATAAYQVEGGWNASDKSVSIWDHFTHTYPDIITDRSNGDVACDSYNKWEEDVELLSQLGVHFYRFSISWPRILPTGFTNYVSEDGVRYYNNLIDGLLAKGIEPLVTIYHWDLPQSLQDLGGWTNPLMADYFADYARVVYSLFGNRVQVWTTINEPSSICDIYMMGTLAPGIYDPDVGTFLCNKIVLIAHAKAWRIYDEEFRHLYNGKVGLTNHMFWFEADSPENEELAELVRQFGTGRYTHPIYSKEGGWPPALEKIMDENSKKIGYSFNRLPAFTQEEIELVRGTYDYNGVNHYSSRVVRKARPGEEVPPWPVYGLPEFDVVLEHREEWPRTGADVFFLYPQGFRHLLSWLKEQYGEIEVFIQENGCAGIGKVLQDDDRVKYYRDNLEQLLLAINEDKINITGYTAWSLMDNFEWGQGYTQSFGLIDVDFNDPERKRTLRKSAYYYSKVIEQYTYDIPEELYSLP